MKHLIFAITGLLAGGASAAAQDACTKRDAADRCLRCEFKVGPVFNNGEALEFVCPGMPTDHVAQAWFEGHGVVGETSGQYGVKVQLVMKMMARDATQGFWTEKPKPDGWDFKMRTAWDVIPQDGNVPVRLANQCTREDTAPKPTSKPLHLSEGTRLTVISEKK